MLVNPKYQDIKEKLDEASVAIDLVRFCFVFHVIHANFVNDQDDSDIANDSDIDDAGSASESEQL